jgi:hypothetical protein
MGFISNRHAGHVWQPNLPKKSALFQKVVAAQKNALSPATFFVKSRLFE